VRYVAHPRQEDGPLRDRLRALAAAHPRWGAPLLTWKLRREGWRDNHKRIERVYRQDGLAEEAHAAASAARAGRRSE
jgi:putative transposase